MGRHGQAATVDGVENFIAAAAEQGFADCVTQRFRIVKIAIARLAQQLRTIGISDNGVKVQPAVANFREGAELAAASLDSGAAGEKLEALIEFTNR